MNKHTVITIAASIIIVGVVGFSFLNAFASKQIEVRGIEPGYFSFFDLTNNEIILACNPSSIPMNIKNISISLEYNDENIGAVNFPDVNLEPNSVSQIQGYLQTDEFKQMQYLTLHFDGMYDGVVPARIHLDGILVKVTTSTPILGVIPYSSTQEFPILSFWEYMNDSHSC